jgi:hypothetical protein
MESLCVNILLLCVYNHLKQSVNYVCDFLEPSKALHFSHRMYFLGFVGFRKQLLFPEISQTDCYSCWRCSVFSVKEERCVFYFTTLSTSQAARNRKIFGRKRLWPNRGTVLAFFRKTATDLNQNRRCHGRGSNRASLRYKSRELPLRQPARRRRRN